MTIISIPVILIIGKNFSQLKNLVKTNLKRWIFLHKPIVKEYFMSDKTEIVFLTDKQKAILQQIASQSSSTVKLAKRAEVVLAATSTRVNSKISEQVGIDRKQVKVWRERWINFAPGLLNAEKEGVGEDKLQEMVIELLSDKSRPGMPNVFSEEQVSQILALAKESPGHHEIMELPEYRENKQVADEAVRLGIVPNISPRSVGRFLKRRNAVAV